MGERHKMQVWGAWLWQVPPNTIERLGDIPSIPESGWRHVWMEPGDFREVKDPKEVLAAMGDPEVLELTAGEYVIGVGEGDYFRAFGFEYTVEKEIIWPHYKFREMDR